MDRFYKVYFRVDTREDNTMTNTIIEIIKDRHTQFIIEDMLEGYWRGFPEETLAIVVIDDEEAVIETVQLIKQELGTQYVAIVDQGDVTVP
jgi:hypothetical protein